MKSLFSVSIILLGASITFASGGGGTIGTDSISRARDIKTEVDITYSKFAENNQSTGKIERYQKTDVHLAKDQFIFPLAREANAAAFSFNPKRRDNHPVVLTVFGMNEEHNYNHKMRLNFSFSDLNLISGKTYKCVNYSYVDYEEIVPEICRANMYDVAVDLDIPFNEGDVCLVKVTTDPEVLDFTNAKVGTDLHRRFPFTWSPYATVKTRNETPLALEFECKSSAEPTAVLKGTFQQKVL